MEILDRFGRQSLCAACIRAVRIRGPAYRSCIIARVADLVHPGGRSSKLWGEDPLASLSNCEPANESAERIG